MLPSKKYTTEDFLAIARKSVALVAIPTAVGLFVSLLYSSRIPDVWEAETLIQVVPQRVPTAFIQSTVTIKTEDRLEALAQQVKSRTQLERMIVDLNLYPEDRATRPMQDVVETMRLAVVLDPVRTNRSGPVEAFYLRFRYSDPVVAARATERLGTLYVDQNARERGALAEGARDFLEAQLADANARLEAQDKKLAQFREQHAGRLPSQLDSNMQAIQNMQLQRQSTVQSLAQDRDRKMMLERLYNDLISSPLTISPSAQAGAPTAEAATLTMPPRQRLELERANLARLQQRLTTDHPDVKRSRRQVEELEALVATAPDAATPATPAGATPEEAQRRERISGLRAEIESLDRQIDFKDAEERRISRTIAEYQGRIEAVPGVESEWLALTRDYDTLNNAFKDLLTKTESARAAVDLEHRNVGEQFRVLDAPRVPLRPVSPRRQLITLAGVGAGLIIGVGLVVLLQLRDGSFKTDRDVEQVLNLPVLAVVPNVVTPGDRARLRLQRQMLTAGAVASVCVCGYVFWAMQLWKFVA